MNLAALARPVCWTLLVMALLAGAACSNSTALRDLEQRVDSLAEASGRQSEISDLRSENERMKSAINHLETMVTDGQSAADDAKTIGDEAQSKADKAYDCSQGSASALDSLTLDDLRYGFLVGVSCP